MPAPTQTGRQQWRNWAGTLSAEPRHYVRAGSIEQVQEAVQAAGRSGHRVRVVGSGHSFSPVVACDDVIIDIGGLHGIKAIDSARKRARIRAGSTVRDLRPALWDNGLAFRNQGGINAQTLAGAVSTATHGSGRAFGSMASAVTRAELITADGELCVFDEGHPSLDAVSPSVGCLGVLVNLEMQLTSAYRLSEDITFRSFDDIVSNWSELLTHRHVTLWWGPTPESIAAFNVAEVPQEVTDPWFVKVLDETDDVKRSDAGASRIGSSYDIYADEYEATWDEMEYFVPIENVFDAIAEVRRVYATHPSQLFPIEVRTIGRESGLLAPAHGRDSVAIAVTAKLGTDYQDFFRDVHAALDVFDARPHWGKGHRFGADRLAEVLPGYAEFVRTRREMDPEGRFLNDHMRALFA